jgi:hypothetical protein
VGEEASAGCEPDAARRFILEIELPRSGRLQLDGLLKGIRLDLIVRMPGALPSALSDRLVTTFHGACRANGHHGAITFKVAREWPVHVGALIQGHPARAVNA